MGCLAAESADLAEAEVAGEDWFVVKPRAQAGRSSKVQREVAQKGKCTRKGAGVRGSSSSSRRSAFTSALGLASLLFCLMITYPCPTARADSVPFPMPFSMSAPATALIVPVHSHRLCWVLSR